MNPAQVPEALSGIDLGLLSTEDLTSLASSILSELDLDRRENALDYYTPVNPDAEPFHYTRARVAALVGGHRSSKSDVMLAEMAAQMTGRIPFSLRAKYPKEKIRPPIRVRLFTTSFQNSFEPQIKKKLQWNEWDGMSSPGGDRGHWGWIPRWALSGGSWDQSWSERQRILRLQNGSTLQVLSYEQSLDDVKTGSYHVVCEDELPPEAFHRQNRMRVMETKGQLMIAATPPDDRGAAISAAWFHDQVYKPGLEGKDPDTFAITLYTERNRLLTSGDIEWLSRGLTDEQRSAQLYGKFLHLAGLIFPEFADRPRHWCFGCEKTILPVDGTCPRCAGSDISEYSHIEEDQDLPSAWPRLFYFDPHPRKPLAGIWVAVDPNDDWWIEHEIEVDPYGGPEEVVKQIFGFEEEHELSGRVMWRKGDSKMMSQRNEYAGQDWSIGKALREAGLEFFDANPSKETGWAELRNAMRLNPWTRKPRLHVMRRCSKVIYQMTHFAWQEHSRRMDQKDLKEMEQDKNSDFPATLRYLCNDGPTWSGLSALWMGKKMVYATGRGRSEVTGY